MSGINAPPEGIGAKHAARGTRRFPPWRPLPFRTPLHTLDVYMNGMLQRAMWSKHPKFDVTFDSLWAGSPKIVMQLDPEEH